MSRIEREARAARRAAQITPAQIETQTAGFIAATAAQIAANKAKGMDYAAFTLLRLRYRSAAASNAILAAFHAAGYPKTYIAGGGICVRW